MTVPPRNRAVGTWSDELRPEEFRQPFTTTMSLKTTQFGHIANIHLPHRPPILFDGGKGNA
jgi:hypothetical protein